MGALGLGQRSIDQIFNDVGCLRECALAEIDHAEGQKGAAEQYHQITEYHENCIAVKPENPRAIRPAVIMLMAAP